MLKNLALPLLLIAAGPAAAQHEDAVAWYLDLLAKDPELADEHDIELNPEESFAVADAVLRHMPADRSSIYITLDRLAAIPQSIGKFKQLETLYIDIEQISDISALQQLPALKELTIHSSRIPSMAALPAASSLNKLDLSSSGIADLEGLDRFTALEALDLSGTKVSGVFPVPGTLRYLDLDYTAITGFDMSRGCNLEIVDISDLRIEDLSPFGECAALERIYMTGAAVTSLSGLSNLTQLGEINAEGAAIRQISDVEGLDGLEWLDLNSNFELESIEGLERFQALEYAMLKGASSHIDFSPLLALPNLKSVDLPLRADPKIVEALEAKGVEVEF